MAEQSELLMAQSDLAMLDARLTMLEKVGEAVRGKLCSMLDLPVDWAVGEMDLPDLPPPAGDLKALLTVARAESQDLKMARQDVTLMELMVRMAETEVLPRGSAGFSQLGPPMKSMGGPSKDSGMAAGDSGMKSAGGPPMGGDSMEGGLVLKGPANAPATSGAMGNDMAQRFPDRMDVSAARAAFGVNAAYLNELRIRVQQARQMAAAANARVAMEVQEMLAMYESAARERREQDEVIVPKAQETFENMRQRYSAGAGGAMGAGAGGLQAFLAAGRARLEALLKQAEARQACNAKVVDLLNALGRSAADALVAAPK
jgi:hypothetical protein